MKKILFIYEKNITGLPPILAVIDSLFEEYNLTFIVREKEEVIEKLYKSSLVKYIAYSKDIQNRSIYNRIYNRIKKHYFFKIFIPKLLEKEKYDLVWILSAETAVLLGNPIKDVNYIFNIYELYDIVPDLLKKIKPIAQNAKRVIVPEFNRAHMLRFWLDLSETPTVIPNKPVKIPLKSKEIPKELSKVSDKKIVLYQGYINRARNLDKLCEVLSSMPEYAVVLMGKGNDDYLSELKSKYPNIIHIEFLPPPSHLMVTSFAYLGIVTYEYTDLNGVYCAPNKIWEYSGYGVPMLGNDIPGLIYTVEKHNAGICIDMKNVKELKKAIEKLATNYNEYSAASKKMFDSVNVKEEICNLVKECI